MSSRIQEFRMRLVVQIGAVGLVLLGGCSSVSNMLPDPKVDYRSSTTRPEAKLEVPPDLVSPRGDERFMLPERVSGATLSGYARERAARDQLAGTGVGAQRDVLPDVTGMKIERAGSMRWLTVKRPPGQLWPVLRTFWQESGFTLAVDQPAIGVMETEWAENRAKIPQDFIRSTIGKVFDGIYSTGERDRFRVRLEAVEGGTEIHLSHRGMVEVPGENKNGFVWTQRPSDPELEAEFLRRLMVRLGSDSNRATADLSPNSGSLILRARALPDGTVQVDESFDRAWRRVGLALDRAGFTVEDRDRSRGVYFVRYVDPSTESGSARSLFDRVFSTNADPTPRRFRIVLVASTVAGQPATDIRVLNRDGAPVADAAERPVATRIASLLFEQLK
jgi:outer membrane protein assembly factor BamC